MEENISEKSGFVRLALGTGMTAFGIAHCIKDSGNKTLGSTLIIAGAMKVAEGIFLYCPMKALLNANMKDTMMTSFDEFLDGDGIMDAYNKAYEKQWNSNGSKTESQSSGQTATNPS